LDNALSSPPTDMPRTRDRAVEYTEAPQISSLRAGQIRAGGTERAQNAKRGALAPRFDRFL
jgi:hypothetical protein